MRVLHVTTELPFPPRSGGQERTWGQLRLLADLVDELAVLSLTEVPVPADTLREMRDALDGSGAIVDVLPPVHHPIHVRRHRWFLARVALRRLLTRRPFVLLKWRSRRVSRALGRALAEHPPDVVYVDHLGMAEHLPEIRRATSAPVVLDEHNVETDFYRQRRDRATGVRRALFAIEARAAARAEGRIVASVDAVVTISEADAAALGDLAVATGHRRPHPVVVPVVVTGRPPRPPGPAHVFGFLGSLSWDANRRGLDAFTADVWPEVRERLPGAELVIAGRGLGRGADGALDVPASWRRPGITTIGEVLDPDRLYDRVGTIVAPTAGGSGVRIKVLDAFAAGRPVVTDVAGAAGLPVSDGVELAIARSPDEWVEHLVRAATDPAWAAGLTDAARRYLAEHHGTGIAAARLRDVLASVRP